MELLVRRERKEKKKKKNVQVINEGDIHAQLDLICLPRLKAYQTV